jgi:hypothetical protein
MKAAAIALSLIGVCLLSIGIWYATNYNENGSEGSAQQV